MSAFKNHFIKFCITLFFILNGCQLQDPNKNHGILFLENRSNKLAIKDTNKNDVIKILGQPHSKSIDNENMWIYIERTLSKGRYHRLGRHTLKENNVLVLAFDKYGILEKKEFYTKEDIQKIAFSESTTVNELSKNSFIESFFSSIREKMYRRR